MTALRTKKEYRDEHEHKNEMKIYLKEYNIKNKDVLKMNQTAYIMKNKEHYKTVNK